MSTDASTAPFPASLGTGDDWRQAAKACLDTLDVGEGGSLGFLYVTDALADDLTSILTLFREVTNVPNWVGTVGIGVAGSRRQVFDQPAVSTMIAPVPSGSCAVFKTLKSDVDAVAGTVDAWPKPHRPVTSIVHADPRNTDMPDLIGDLSDRYGLFLLGGLAASRTDYPAICNRVETGGVSGVLFDDRVELASGLSQGCSPIGPVRTVTKAERNIIAEIDGEPALSILKEDIGDVLARDLRRLGGYIFAGLPVRGSDTGDYLVRNLVGIDPNSGLIAIAEEIDPGRQIVFTRRDRASASEDLDRMLERLKARQSKTPRGGLYVSCVARGPNMFDGDNGELDHIDRVFPGLPVTGFFANGEISGQRLYGYTGVLTLFY